MLESTICLNISIHSVRLFYSDKKLYELKLIMLMLSIHVMQLTDPLCEEGGCNCVLGLHLSLFKLSEVCDVFLIKSNGQKFCGNFLSKDLNWLQANNLCMSLRARLPVIKTMQEIRDILSSAVSLSSTNFFLTSCSKCWFLLSRYREGVYHQTSFSHMTEWQRHVNDRKFYNALNPKRTLVELFYSNHYPQIHHLSTHLTS